jgi:hypothetical protein
MVVKLNLVIDINKYIYRVLYKNKKYKNT